MGIPFIKFLKIYPGKSNDALLTDIAKTAATEGKANALINVCPASENFAGFIIGLYIDTCKGGSKKHGVLEFPS